MSRVVAPDLPLLLCVETGLFDRPGPESLDAARELNAALFEVPADLEGLLRAVADVTGTGTGPAEERRIAA